MTITEQFTEMLVEYPRRTVLTDARGAYSNEDIYNVTQFLLSEHLQGRSFSGKRIAVFCRPGLGYVSAMMAGWMSGAMVVPLCVTHPEAELKYILDDAAPEIVFAEKEIASRLPKSSAKIIQPDYHKSRSQYTPANYTNALETDPALMLYTSGTTGKPKGVVHLHASLAAQITCLVNAWNWQESDRILHFLPLHHTHGIINKWLCALWVGARCDMMEKFDVNEVLDRMKREPYTRFMAVPTVYAKLIEALQPIAASDPDSVVALFSHCNLMVSGSAALPVSVLEKWKSLTGHTLLERYGMTETGMVLSNPLEGERRAGTVGHILPGMQVRLIDEAGKHHEEEGELQVKGAHLFSGYWNREAETKSSFTADGWFKTGDMVSLQDGYYRIVGRLSTDIIKSGGYKISALEIESVLLEHPLIRECAVCGVADETWGERICAALVMEGNALTLEEIRSWLKDKIAVYKIPTEVLVVPILPRNAMGKAVKSEIRTLFSSH